MWSKKDGTKSEIKKGKIRLIISNPHLFLKFSHCFHSVDFNIRTISTFYFQICKQMQSSGLKEDDITVKANRQQMMYTKWWKIGQSVLKKTIAALLFILLILWFEYMFIWLGLWCLTSLSTIFQLYHGGQLLVEETEVPRENPWPVTSHWQHLSHNVASSTLHHHRVHV